MEKKIYVPTNEELLVMQDMEVNVYKYLLVKAIEALTIEGTKFPSKGILKSAYKYLREDPDIAYAICRMYPKELKYSEIARYDVSLCKQILSTKKDMSIYELDNLAYFNEGVTSNIIIAELVIDELEKKLPSTPQYRFEYIDSVELDDGSINQSSLINDIFGVKYLIDQSTIYSPELIRKLTTIEPAYNLRISDDCFNQSHFNWGNQNKQGKSNRQRNLETSIDSYAARYKLDPSVGSEYIGQDIINKPDTNVKRLMRCIHQNKNNLY